MKSQNRYRRKRVKTNKKSNFYPWIGTTDSAFDLFSSKRFGKQVNPSTAYGDSFLWRDPGEVSASEIQPWFGSYKEGSALTFESYIPKVKTRTGIKTATVDSSAEYIGGTCFFDPISVSVTSAFETSGVIPWPGEGFFNTEINTQAVPVGGVCFAREGLRNGSNIIGSLDPTPTGPLFFSGTWASNVPEDFHARLRTYFRQTETFNDVNEVCRRDQVAGEDIALYFCDKSGSITTFTNAQDASPLPNQFILQDDAVFGAEIALLNGAGISKYTSTETVDQSDFSSGPICKVTARDVTTNDYSDGYVVTSVSPKYWTDITINGSLDLNTSVTITVNSGAYSGPSYIVGQQFNQNNSEGYKIEYNPGVPGSTWRQFYNDFTTTLPNDFYAVITPPKTGGGFEDPLDWQDADTTWDDAATTSQGEIQYLITDEGTSSSSSYALQPNYRFKDIDFLNTKFILVSKNAGRRYHLTVTSTDFIYLTTQTGNGAPPSIGTSNINGTTFTCTVDASEEVFWDSGAGELADMSTDLLIYAENNINRTHVLPENTQFYGTDQEWELVTEAPIIS